MRVVMYRKTLSLIFALTFLILWQTSISWAGCWKTARNQNSKVWFETCSPSTNGNCDNQCTEFEWIGGPFDLYGHGAGKIKFYQSGRLIKEEERTLYFGAYEPTSIRRLSNGDEYIGETKGGAFNGQGVYLKTNGEKYLGSFRDSKPSGYLSYYIGSTLNYHGQWVNGIKSGKGVLYEKDKTVEGSWNDGKLNGPSIIKLHDGTAIEANYFNGLVTNKARIIYPSGDTYEGEITSNYLRNGYGTYRYKNGDEYQGQWSNNQQSGEGKYVEKGKVTKEGKWVEGKLSDVEETTQIYDNGEKYIGDVRNGSRDGFGIYYFSNGSTYEGYWHNGRKNGEGKYSLTDGRFYEGDWENDKRHGFGVFVFQDGSKYVGEWKDDKRTGTGELLFKDGSKYDGDWLGGTITGKGTLALSDGSYYSGDWKNNKKNGKGIFIWADGSSLDEEWTNDIPQGDGIYVWPNGDQYEGSLKDGYLDGSGTFFYANNDQYEGSFSFGQKSGYGKYFFANGNIYEGNFVDGQPNGRGIFTFKDGTRYEGEFKDGKFYGDGSLYINKRNAFIVYTGSWDATTKLPRFASILFQNGDLFEGETDGNGRPTNNGKWTTLAERKSLEAPAQNQDSIHRANEFYKNHKGGIDTCAQIAMAVLSVASLFPPTAPIAVPTLTAISIADSAIQTASKSIDIHDAYKAGNNEKVVNLSEELAEDLAINAAFYFAPKVVPKVLKKSAEKMIPTVNNLIPQQKGLQKIVIVKKIKSKLVKTLEKCTHPPRAPPKPTPSKIRTKIQHAKRQNPAARRKPPYEEEAEYYEGLPKIRLTNSKLQAITADLLREIRKYTGKSGSQGFIEFFLRIGRERTAQLWANPKVRQQVAQFIRGSGGQHEWLMVKNFIKFLTDPKWKKDKYKLIVLMKRLVNATKDVQFKSGGWHGGKGSTSWHNELSSVIDKSKNLHDLLKNIDEFAKRTLTKESYSKFAQVFRGIA